jgi:UvrD/REP helicase subfamily protein
MNGVVMSEYLDKIVDELKRQGIKAPETASNSNVPIISDRELQIIESMEQASGKKFSEEQRKILEHHGSACILACAGSGKTTTSINLIAKRILTGEIHDVNKLIYTTYSKAGATEMKERLDKLLKSLGMGHINVKVQTIHAFFLSVLRTFGNNAVVITASKRSAMIRKACLVAEFSPKDDELMQIDNLLSYQVNNLLSDRKTIESYVNTIDSLTLEQYSTIRKEYATYKSNDGVIDYDDMQSYLYLWLIKWAKSSNPNEQQMAVQVRDYCKAVYTDFYIDEAQDVSKIQFAIIRAIVEDPNNKGKLDRNLVFIGDDDQCLPVGTEVHTTSGIKNIEDIQILDKILAGCGHSKTMYGTVDNISSKYVETDLYVVKTKSGKTIKATGNHIGFAKIVPVEGLYYTYLMYRHDFGFRIGTTSEVRSGNRREIRNGIDIRLMQERADKIWIIKTSNNIEESKYFEAYYAYKYSIPMYMFVTSDSGNGIPETSLSKNYVRQLHNELNTFENGKRLLSDLGMFYDYPHRVPQAEGERCKINHSLFSSKQLSKYGMHNSEISINTSNEDFISTFEDVLSITDRKSSTKYNYKNARNSSSDIDKQAEIVKMIQDRCCDKNIYLEVNADAKFTKNKFIPLPFSHLGIGMIIPTVVEHEKEEFKVIDDEIVDIQREAYKGLVYDLSVPETRNFVADGVIVHNCIYQWRGSDPNIILSISATFDMQTFLLSTNYRCHKEILEYSARGIKHNGSRYPKNMEAFNDCGSVKILPISTEDLCTLSIAAMNNIKYWLNNGNDSSDIAVLSRNNFHLAILSNMLLREGIYCNITEDMKLTKSYMYQQVKDIISITEQSWKKELTARVLWRLCRYLGVKTSGQIARFQDDCALSFEDTLGYIVKHYIDKDIKFSKKLNITIQASEQMQYIMSKVGKETRDDLAIVYNAITCGNRAEAIEALLFQYLEATSFLYRSRDKNRSVRGLVKYINNLIKKDGVDGMINFLRMTEQFENGDMVIPGSKVTLTTIHSAKGREWKNVIMFACDNVSQPSFDCIYKMISDDIPVSDIYNNIDEERRLFYVGNTRAIEKLLIITYNEPSAFILEALGAFGEPTNNNERILTLVQDRQWVENYKSFIQDNILDEKSKYYYDKEKYGLQV